MAEKATTAASSRNRGPRRSVFIDFQGLKYGFATPLEATRGSVLGHTDYTGAEEAVVFGVNSPKPNRAVLDTGTRTFSSFVAPAAEDAARKAKWRIIRNGRRRGAGKTLKTVTVALEMPGVAWKYAWRMDAVDFNEHKTVLGLEEATGGGLLVWGGSLKPPRATKVLTDGSTVSSFIAPKAAIIDKAAGEGWAIFGVNYDLIPAAAGP